MVSTLVFMFMCTVSTIIFLTEENLDIFDYMLMIVTPFALSGLFYIVVLHHDPNASD